MCSCCCNKSPQPGGLKQQNSSSHRSEGQRRQQDVVPPQALGEDPSCLFQLSGVPWLTASLLHLCFHPHVAMVPVSPRVPYYKDPQRMDLWPTIAQDDFILRVSTNYICKNLISTSGDVLSFQVAVNLGGHPSSYTLPKRRRWLAQVVAWNQGM